MNTRDRTRSGAKPYRRVPCPSLDGHAKGRCRSRGMPTFGRAWHRAKPTRPSVRRLGALLAVVLTLAPTAEAGTPRRSAARMELAVQSGLAYLASRQKADGSFACDKYPAAVTGLACLAVLAHRDDRLPEKHEAMLRQGLDFILRQQDENGMVGSSLYEHAIATLVALQMLGMGEPDEDSRLAAFCRKAVAVTLEAGQVRKSRRAQGGWAYEPTSKQSDLSNTSWQVLVLFSANQCGFEVPPGLYEEALKYVQRCRQKEGYGYKPAFTQRSGKAHRSLTGVALFLKSILDPASLERDWQVLDWLTAVPPSWGGKQYRGYFFCASFYLTQGMFQLGGERWETYYDQLVAVLLEHQESDGHWPLPHDNLEESRKAGPVYATAMAILQLSLEKQYLPIYQRQKAILH